MAKTSYSFIVYYTMLILSYTRLYKVIQGYADGSIECIGIVLSIHKSVAAVLWHGATSCVLVWCDSVYRWWLVNMHALTQCSVACTVFVTLPLCVSAAWIWPASWRGCQQWWWGCVRGWDWAQSSVEVLTAQRWARSTGLSFECVRY